jgi:hypothetical protein
MKIKILLESLNENSPYYAALMDYLSQEHDAHSNSILHRLAIAFGICCSPEYTEIHDNYWFFYRIQELEHIVQTICQDTQLIRQLTQDPHYVFNQENKTALHLLLDGYRNTPFLRISEDDPPPIPMLNDLLIRYPKAIILGIYDSFSSDASFVHQFYKNKIKDAFSDAEILVARSQFHDNNIAEHIFPGDFTRFESRRMLAQYEERRRSYSVEEKKRNVPEHSIGGPCSP